MAADGNVHLTKQSHHLVGGDPELAGHVVYAKLAQTTLLWGSCRARLHERANPFRELTIHDANDGGGLASRHSSEFGGARYLYESNPPGIQKRDHLVQTVVRGVGRHDRERHLVLLDRFTNTLHSYKGTAPADPEPDKPKEPRARRRIQHHSLAPPFAEWTSPSA